MIYVKSKNNIQQDSIIASKLIESQYFIVDTIHTEYSVVLIKICNKIPRVREPSVLIQASCIPTYKS